MKVVLGVAGGIAAYKACSLLRLLTEAGHDVTVVPTAAALHFVGEATWSALSGKPVHTDVWSDITEVPHVRIGQEADLVVVAPATADLSPAPRQARPTTCSPTCCSRPAARSSWPPRCTPRCGSTPPPRPTSRRSASAASTSCPRPPGGSPGATPARVAFPSPRTCIAVCERELARAAADGRHAAGGTASGVFAVPPRRPGGAARRRERRRHPRAARPGALPRQPLLGQAGLCAGPRPPPSGAPSVTLVSSSSLPAPAGCGRARRDRPRAPGRRDGCRARRRRRRHGCRRGRLPAGGVRRPQDQEDPRRRRRRLADDVGARRGRWCATPTSSPASSRPGAAPRRRSSSGSPPRPATATARCSTTPAPSSPARAATCSSSTRSGSA